MTGPNIARCEKRTKPATSPAIIGHYDCDLRMIHIHT